MLTETEAAKYQGRSKRTLQGERLRGTGCTYFKINNSVRYRQSDLECFLESCRRNSTSDPGPGPGEFTDGTEVS